MRSIETGKNQALDLIFCEMTSFFFFGPPHRETLRGKKFNGFVRSGTYFQK